MITFLGASFLVLAVGAIFGIIIDKKLVKDKLDKLQGAEDKIANAAKEAEGIKENAKREAENIRKESELKLKEDIYKKKENLEKELNVSRKEIQQREIRIMKKEENLDKKLEKIESKEKELENKGNTLKDKENEINTLKDSQLKELERISGLSQDDAKNILLNDLEKVLVREKAIKIRDFENKIKDEEEKITQKVISTAIDKASAEFVVEASVSVVQLPNDEMKGRIIGREGRNIRAIEAATGVDVIIDDTPEAVVLSSFDSVRREIARLTMEKLVSDGRIHPTKIEEAVEKSRKEVDKAIVEAGESALLELGIHGVHPELIKTLGRLRYRTSYGQNVLTHSIEVANMCSVMAAELGLNVELAKRAGLFHDIGKALDHDVEGSHALIGGKYLRKFNEDKVVVNGAESHHLEVEPISCESLLVKSGDALSASRPGARRETLQTYIKRLESLEQIANEFEGVENSYAIQAGREIRIIVKPDEVNDDVATNISRDISRKIEEQMHYPGQIKVTVIRETRSVEYAR